MRRIERWHGLGYYEKIIHASQRNGIAFQGERLFYLASAYYRVGQREAALHTYRQAFGGMPEAEAVFHLEYARLLHEKGDWVKARQQYQIALEKGVPAQEIQLYLSYLQNATKPE